MLLLRPLLVLCFLVVTVAVASQESNPPSTVRRRLQSLKRVTNIGDYQYKPSQYLLSLRRFLALNEQTFRWSKEWFPKPLRDAWFATAGESLQKLYHDYILAVLDYFLPIINRLVNENLSRVLLGDGPYGSGDTLAGGFQFLWTSNILGNLLSETMASRGTEELGRTLLTQFTVNTTLTGSTLLDGALTAIVHGAFEDLSDPTHNLGQFETQAAVVFNSAIFPDLVRSAKFSVNGFKLPWGYKFNQMANTCLEGVTVLPSASFSPDPIITLGEITFRSASQTATCAACGAFAACTVGCSILPAEITASLSAARLPWDNVANRVAGVLPICESGVSDGLF